MFNFAKINKEFVMDKENVLAQFQEKAKNAAPIGGIIKFIIV